MGLGQEQSEWRQEDRGRRREIKTTRAAVVTKMFASLAKTNESVEDSSNQCDLSAGDSVKSVVHRRSNQ